MKRREEYSERWGGVKKEVEENEENAGNIKEKKWEEKGRSKEETGLGGKWNVQDRGGTSMWLRKE